MPVTESNYSLIGGATIRYVRVNPFAGTTLYPTDFDDRFRFVRMATIRLFKSTVIAERAAEMLIEREGDAILHRIWGRFFESGDDTTTPANLQALEIAYDATAFMVPSQETVGNGLIIPPRSRFNFTLSSDSGFSTEYDLIIIETADPQTLALFI